MSNGGDVFAERKAELVAEMVAHVEGIAFMRDITIIYYSGNGRAWRGKRIMKIRPVKGLSTYFAALHELGHIIGPGQNSRSYKLEREANAWQWALDAAIRKPTPTVRKTIAHALRSYLNAGRRGRGLRQGMIEPPRGHIFWKLANPRGLERVEPRAGA